jgi:1,4-dihydroxy-2-naphthoate octaprenyltransferase
MNGNETLVVLLGTTASGFVTRFHVVVVVVVVVAVSHIEQRTSTIDPCSVSAVVAATSATSPIRAVADVDDSTGTTTVVVEAPAYTWTGTISVR